MSAVEPRAERYTSVDAVAGLLASASLVLSGITMGLGLLLELDARPSRYGPVAMILALVAARMSERHQRLSLAAAAFAILAWIVGMALMIWTENPII